MAGIAAAEVGADSGPGAAPEARQVARDLDRAMRGRKKLERERNTPARQRRMILEPEQFLDAQCNRRAAFRFVVNRRLCAGRRAEMRRRLVVEAAPLLNNTLRGWTRLPVRITAA